MAFKASPSSQHQHCNDEAQKAETVLSAVIYIYIYIYIYIHPFTKTLLFQKYISYICTTVEKRLKQGGHISSVIPLWPLPSVFYINVFSDVDKKDTSAEKA